MSDDLTPESSPEAAGKDTWDKAEIIGKVAIPVIIAITALTLNDQLSQRAQDAEVIKIAVAILSERPSEEGASNSALRSWAIDEMVVRADLSQDAAEELIDARLPVADQLIPQPQCEIWIDRQIASSGEVFRVQWSGWPIHSTIFEVNGTQQDANDAASYTFPKDRTEPITFTINGSNSSGSCSDDASITTVIGGTPAQE